MESQNKLTGLKKRQQIASANKTIFVWVAIAAVAVSFCAVALQFLIREGLFNQKIINAKSETSRTLDNNIAVASELKTNVDKLLANKDLQAARSDNTTNNLQVVLDALPVSGDSTNFASSLQQVIFPHSRVEIVALSTGGSQVIDPNAVEATTALAEGVQELPFSASIKANYQRSEQALADLSKVIRPIDLTNLAISGADQSLQVTINGKTYYQPEKTLQLKEKTIEP